MVLKSLVPSTIRVRRVLSLRPALAALVTALAMGQAQVQAQDQSRPLDLSIPVLAYAPEFLPQPWPGPETSVAPEDLPEQDLLEEEEAEGYIDRGMDYLLIQHRSISTQVEVMARAIDRYFAGEGALAEDNETYMRVRLAETWIEGGRWEEDNDLKFRLDLPATKDRYRFVVAYRPDDEEETLADRTLPSSTARPTDGEQSFFAGAVRTVKDEARHWEGRAQLGIKARWPLDPFVRLNSRREVRISDHWALNVRNGGAWYTSSGFRTEHSLAFDRILTPAALFRTTTSAQWREEDDTLEFAQVFDLFHSIDQRRLLDYQIGVLGNSWSHSHVNIYYASVIYRQDLYRQWLYLNLVPQIAFPREENFNDIVSFTAGIEIFFNQF